MATENTTSQELFPHLFEACNILRGPINQDVRVVSENVGTAIVNAMYGIERANPDRLSGVFSRFDEKTLNAYQTEIDKVKKGVLYRNQHSGYLMDYNIFLGDLKEFIDGRRCAVCIRCKEEWMGCFTAREDELSEESLVKQANKMLSAREFQQKLRENGYRIECSFLDASKDRVFEIKAR